MGTGHFDAHRLEALVSGAEPQSLRTWLSPGQAGRMMSEGSVTPALGASWHSHGRLLAPAPAAQPIDFASVYLVLDDYVPGLRREAATDLIDEIVATVPREDLLVSLVNLLALEGDAELMRRLRPEFAKTLHTRLTEAFLAVTDPRARDSRRVLSRQGVLAAMKAALRGWNVPARSTAVPAGVAAILLVHACSMLLAARSRHGDELMMEIIRNFDFNRMRDTAVHVADHLEKWERFGSGSVSHLGASAPELVERLTGLTVRDFVAFAFAVGHQAITYEPGQPLGVDPALPGITRPAEDVAAFLGAVSATPDELLREYDAGRDSPWNFVPFQRRPVLRLSNGHLVVVEDKLLFDRVTDGLYWDVHDRLRDTEGDRARLAWTRAYGDIVEEFVRDRFTGIAPVGFDGPTLYSEDEQRQAFPRSKVCDGVIDMGGVFLAVEVVSGRLTLESRVHGDVAAFRRDTEKIVLKKARQLDAVSKALLSRESALTGRPAVLGRRVQPLLIAGAGYPVEPLSGAYVRREAEREGLFRDARVEPLAVVSLDEWSMLTALAESGHAPQELISGWQQSGISRISLRNWLLQRFRGEAQTFRPARCEALWDGLGDQVTERLGLRQ